MALQINKSTFAAWPVTFRLAQEGGTIHEESVTIHYKVGNLNDQTCSDSIVGWAEGAFMDGDQPVPYSQENLARLFANPEIAEGLVRGFQEICRGEHLRKN